MRGTTRIEQNRVRPFQRSSPVNAVELEMFSTYDAFYIVSRHSSSKRRMRREPVKCRAVLGVISLY